MLTGLHVEVDGDRHRDTATPIVLVNGAWCTTRQWDNVTTELASSRMVIRHDVRGTGSSAAGPPSENTFETYADDIIALGATFGVERFHLWGMAWGARLALVTAARHPGAVSKLMLFDLSVDPADPEAQKRGVGQAKEARAKAGIVEVNKPAMEQLDPMATRSTLDATKFHPDLMPIVRQVEAPTLLVTGEFDPNLISTRRALPGFRHAKLEVLPLTGHGSVLQRPELCSQLVSDFLAT